MANNDALKQAARRELARRELERRAGTGKPAEDKGLLQKGYALLNKPAEKSKEGLDMLAGMVPGGTESGNVALDVLTGTPKVAAETLAEAAPKFIDAPSILTAGAAKLVKPAVAVANAAGRGLSQFGKLSGATPEALQAMAKDPSILLAKGRQAAGKAVGAAADAAKGPLRLEQIKEPKKLIETAEALAKRGKLTPGEAVRARQEVDALYDSKTITGAAQRRLRAMFDKVAKSSPEVAKADREFVRGAHAERLRSPVPLTKSGDPRQLVTGALLTSAAYNPFTLLAAPLVSPLTQALLAGGGGAATRALAEVTPAAAVAGENLLETLTKKKGK